MLTINNFLCGAVVSGFIGHNGSQSIARLMPVLNNVIEELIDVKLMPLIGALVIRYRKGFFQSLFYGDYFFAQNSHIKNGKYKAV